ncbi:MAG: hypothetical protein IH905_07145 [Proteobacteria bacterium]|nr:hypothetical protein [Pseudomonadota bacterium]
MTTSTIAFAETAPRPDALMRRTLAVNAIFSGLSGAAMIVLSGPLDRFMGLGLSWLLIVIGVGLLGFAVLIGLNLRRPQLNRAEAWLTVASDVAWVAGSAIIVFGFPDLLSTGGKWLVGLIAVAVGDFALFQYLGLRRSRA